MATINGGNVTNLIIACDAGMGSSAMLATRMNQKLAPLGVAVKHSAVADIPANADLVLCHTSLADRARTTRPGVVVLGFKLFIGDPMFDKVIAAIKDKKDITG